MAAPENEPRVFSKRRKKMFPDAQMAFLFLFILLLFNPSSAGSTEMEFFGADENKIRETPRYLKICRKSDKNLDECIKSSLEKFMEKTNSGLEELNLPNLAPIKLPFLEFQLGSGSVILHVIFKDFRIDGFNNFKVTNVKSNLIDSKFEISVENPSVIMTAHYSAEGGIYTFPIASDGDFFLSLTNVSAVVIFHLSTTDVLPGLSYFTVEKCLMDFLSSEISAHFGGHVDGSNAMGLYTANCADVIGDSYDFPHSVLDFQGEAFNTFFNKNSQEIFTLIKPKLSKVLADIFGSVANEILSRHPVDVLLPE